MRKQIKVICDYCHNDFLKAESEIKRSKNNNHYCSKSCATKSRTDKVYYRYNISNHCNNRLDQYTCYRWYMKTIKNRSNYDDVTLQDLDIVWKNQKGICPYTGIQLRLKTHNDKPLDTYSNPFEFASLDRIDSSKPYTLNNIEFVSIGINYLKNKFTKEQTISFINNIKN